VDTRNIEEKDFIQKVTEARVDQKEENDRKNELGNSFFSDGAWANQTVIEKINGTENGIKTY